jgi:hypothetical protein
MLRIYSVFCVLAVLIGGGLAFVGWPHANAAVTSTGNDDRFMRAYAQVHTGMPLSRLNAVGLDTAKAERLSKLALMERFMPSDSVAFDALDPAVKNCYQGRDDCTAYIFEAASAQAVVLVQGGRVTWKMIANVAVT